jgi:Flp pilus assembly pilin Flp
MTDLTNKMYIRLSALWSRDEGQTMAEYAIILVVVAIAAVAAFALFKDDIAAALGHVGDKMNPPSGP